GLFVGCDMNSCEEDMRPRSSITGLCAAVIVIAFSALPADARKKEKPSAGQWTDAPYASDRRPVARGQADSSGVPSFDGRYTGRPRTCGFDTFQYEGPFGGGTTVGPYCH